VGRCVTQQVLQYHQRHGAITADAALRRDGRPRRGNISLHFYEFWTIAKRFRAVAHLEPRQRSIPARWQGTFSELVPSGAPAFYLTQPHSAILRPAGGPAGDTRACHTGACQQHNRRRKQRFSAVNRVLGLNIAAMAHSRSRNTRPSGPWSPGRSVSPAICQRQRATLAISAPYSVLPLPILR
jgi:hypothetical protein